LSYFASSSSAHAVPASGAAGHLDMLASPRMVSKMRAPIAGRLAGMLTY
jgi:hypothetical protein